VRIAPQVDGLDLPPQDAGIDVNDGSTLQLLYEAVKGAATLQIGRDITSLTLYLRERELSKYSHATLSSAGIDAESTVRAVISTVPRPRVSRCEPPFGPTSGGTPVKLHGEGFIDGLGFGGPALHIRFGQQIVPARKVSDSTLLCVAPPHPVGPVRVRLGCGGEEHDALYEFVSPERMYDAIFASTNSYCPIRSKEEGEEEKEDAPRWTSL